MANTAASAPNEGSGALGGWFWLLWAGQSASLLGSFLTAFCVKLWLLQQRDSSSSSSELSNEDSSELGGAQVTRAALVTVCATLPSLLVTPFAGVLADRVSRRKLLVLADLLAWLASWYIALAAWEGQLRASHIYIASVVHAVASAVQVPAFEASIPQLLSSTAGVRGLERANALFELSSGLSQLLVPALGGVLLAWKGLAFILAIDLISLLPGVLPLCFMPWPSSTSLSPSSPSAPPSPRHPHSLSVASSLADMREALRWMWQSKGIRWLLLLSTLGVLADSYIAELIPPLLLRVTFAEADSATAEAATGVVISIAGSGALAGSIIASVFGTPWGRVKTVWICLFCQGLLMLMAVCQARAPTMAAVGFVLMFLDPLFGAASAALWQSKVPPAMAGRVTAFRHMLGSVALPVGAITAAPLIDYLFEPLMLSPPHSHHSIVVKSLAAIIGTGPGRGISLLFICVGVLLCTCAAGCGLMTSLRTLEKDLPDNKPSSDTKQD